MQIAIVDDDPVARQILRVSLIRCGNTVIELTDGLAAWNYFNTEGMVRFVITDWLMPGMDGLELIRRIRTANFPGYVYVMILSGKENKTDLVKGLEAGADDYLVKPFIFNELKARVSIGLRVLNLETDLKQASSLLEEMALHDSLTGLYNRRAIYQHLDAELNRAQREKRPLSLVMLDIDQFKPINDRYGHLTGDKVLKQAAEISRQSVRSYDWVGRWGGDEFFIILPGASSTCATNISERILTSLRSIHEEMPDGSELTFTASIGIYTYQGEKTELDQLVQFADDALYQAKNSGRGRVVANLKE
ncbi:MAG: diguanylate cyclase [Anaerolineaceae bacterium]|nr:diguanylate cyclase [Anaerolineaceae bacterium]